jgi:hypothetical protein
VKEDEEADKDDGGRDAAVSQAQKYTGVLPAPPALLGLLSLRDDSRLTKRFIVDVREF